MGRTDTAAHDPSVADRVLSHEVRKYRRATSPASPGRKVRIQSPEDIPSDNGEIWSPGRCA